MSELKSLIVKNKIDKGENKQKVIFKETPEDVAFQQRSLSKIEQFTKWAIVKRIVLRKKVEKKREIRVFVSSTFKDFAEERDEIIIKAFSEVCGLCICLLR